MESSTRTLPRRGSKAKQDDSIMATNNSSIVSKRSVERLYYPEPHFFRYFVKKPQRRSPLINRGYWLRMHAVETVVRRFLDDCTDKPKLVINLGCGYDPLPFQWLSTSPERCENTMFVDIDYPELLTKKLKIVSETPQLADLVGPCQETGSSKSVLYRTPHYIAIGCDLANIEALDHVLAKELDVKRSMILCTAEVSVTYMRTEAADSLIGWAAQYKDIRFCLLEQYLPDGASHPFAQKMIQHFDNLHTPLRSIQQYPQLSDQENRFLQAGWRSAHAISLWELWNNPSFLTEEQRLRLNDVEPFDEWEDMVLFASHYCLLEASNGVLARRAMSNGNTAHHKSTIIDDTNCSSTWCKSPMNFTPSATVGSPRNVRRRFGAALSLSPGVIGHHDGLGSQSRNNSTDVYRKENAGHERQVLPPGAIEARMCHTITCLKDGSSLLVGGRSSPDHARSDSWLGRNQTWERVDDLPFPVYRHCACSVVRSDGEEAVLIFGGRTNSRDALNHWLLWRDSTGWIPVSASGDTMSPRFGAAMVSTSESQGIILGGMAADGTIYQEMWLWEVADVDASPSISLVKCMNSLSPSKIGPAQIYRFGACVVQSSIGILLVGGVADRVLPNKSACICLPGTFDDGLQSTKPFVIEWSTSVRTQDRPLLVGHSILEQCGSVIAVGGGVNCFSFGTYWNQSICTLHSSTYERPPWELDNPACNKAGENPTQQPETLLGSHFNQVSVVDALRAETVRSSHVATAKDFDRIVNNSKPVEMKNMELGACLTEWSFDTLKQKIGNNRLVVVHEASEQHMNFQTKNFRYTTKPLGQCLDEIASGSAQYLRTLSAEKPAEKPAEFASDFPELAAEFILPPQLRRVSQNAHSSPLRISGPVNMWLHYDIMANVLCQIKGRKRVMLYPPSDIVHLEVPPGESSSSMNIFGAEHATNPSRPATHPQEAILGPGDVLFIPPLWLHASSPLENTSISINVFFRNLEAGYAAGRDVYGNRDVQAYEKARKDVARMVKSFDHLPAPMSRFYLERLASELREKAVSLAP